MKSWLKPIFLFLLSLGTIGILVAVSGIMPIGASGGHWKITASVLSFAMERSISTYSLLVEDAPKFNRRMVLQGAGHYDLSCRNCHGGPEKRGFIGLHTTPKAPFLPAEIGEWDEKELFQIVKHGVKFTGMPAWPDLARDDEVWGMVAFLKELPQLNRETYSQLVYGHQDELMPNFRKIAGEGLSSRLHSCSHCHGADGNGREGAFPKLAGQKKHYLVDALEAYRSGTRHSGTMELIAHDLTDEEIRELARFYSSHKRTPEKIISGTPALLKEGEDIARNGIPEKRVAACVRCHGPLVEGHALREEYPDLRGQPASYLKNQLDLFLSDKRGGSFHYEIMKKAVPELSESERRAVSLYYESLPPKN